MTWMPLTLDRALADNIPASQLWNVALANEDMAAAAYHAKDGKQGDRLKLQSDHLYALARDVHKARKAGA